MCKPVKNSYINMISLPFIGLQVALTPWVIMEFWIRTLEIRADVPTQP